MCRRDQDLLDSVRGPPRRYRAVITTYAHPCGDHRQWFCRPSWLSFNPSTRTFSGTPTSTNVGTISVRGTANDLGSLAASETFNIGFDDAERRADGGCRYGRRHREGRRSQRLRRRRPLGTCSPENTDPDAGDTKTVTAVSVNGTAGMASAVPVQSSLEPG
nr:putative Ig domain-containing protein [Sinorhizobium meliloti]